MARVKYPFILCYSGGEKDRFAKEPDPLDPLDLFEKVEDQLLATVYHNLKEFKAGFDISPTDYLKQYGGVGLNHGIIATTIYVG